MNPKRGESHPTRDVTQQTEFEDEKNEVIDWLKRYTSNIDSLLGKDKSKEVKKVMINFLVEQL